RRHTRCYRDWSSDVCSSDLLLLQFIHPQRDLLQLLHERLDLLGANAQLLDQRHRLAPSDAERPAQSAAILVAGARVHAHGEVLRSEERRVGTECRAAW